MVFNSVTFILFFLLVGGLYSFPFSWRAKKILLVSASYLFYATWNPLFLLQVIFLTVFDWQMAKAIRRAQAKSSRRALLFVSCTISLSLAILFFFKFGIFFLENLNNLLQLTGKSIDFQFSNLILPLGISFYTFESISYIVDVYKGRVDPAESLLDYALFISFFPHLVAGPIVRAKDFIPQCVTPRSPSLDQITWGLCLLTFGVFQKAFLADTLLAPVADIVFLPTSVPGMLDAWIGTLAFSGQIYFDFAGYSSCGIGVALCFGFVLCENFRFPYSAESFTEFWKRWHISLSSWLRDYLYIPLGGNRNGNYQTYRNIMLTMLLGGLWHGASWKFVAWGGFHGALLILEKKIGPLLDKFKLRNLTYFAQLKTLVVFLVVSILWIFFRAENLQSAGKIIFSIAGQSPSAKELLSISQIVRVLFVTLALLVLQIKCKRIELHDYAFRLPKWALILTLVLFLILSVFGSGVDRAFIYFQF